MIVYFNKTAEAKIRRIIIKSIQCQNFFHGKFDDKTEIKFSFLSLRN